MYVLNCDLWSANIPDVIFFSGQKSPIRKDVNETASDDDTDSISGMKLSQALCISTITVFLHSV